MSNLQKRNPVNKVFSVCMRISTLLERVWEFSIHPMLSIMLKDLFQILWPGLYLKTFLKDCLQFSKPKRSVGRENRLFLFSEVSILSYKVIWEIFWTYFNIEMKKTYRIWNCKFIFPHKLLIVDRFFCFYIYSTLSLN